MHGADEDVWFAFQAKAAFVVKLFAFRVPCKACPRVFPPNNCIAKNVLLQGAKKDNALCLVQWLVWSVHVRVLWCTLQSDLSPFCRLLVRRARKLAQQYELMYSEPIPTSQLVQKVAYIMQEYTQTGGVRPFGVSLLVAGWDNGRGYVFQCDPSGAYFPWKATAMGKNQMSGKAFLEKRYSEELELEDAVHTAILTLKEGFEGQMTADNIEVGLCDATGFRRLSPKDVRDYLANIV
ncbi:proteasome subunit alpha type-2-like [Dermacentor silvarum]|uniref:proteasome subunit alpha type-2-like n=1 Tax=Dermacentor silvarum TaxID=543639 RepID=UPI00210199BF|nr:proteasome subunit alpha type-2-like [Dermacentor silvarum]